MDYTFYLHRTCILLAAIVLCVAYKSAKECQEDFYNCQSDSQMLQIQTNNVTLYCQSARTYLKCVERLDCEKEMYMRLAYKILDKNMTDLNTHCELGTPPDNRDFSNKAPECKKSVGDCRDRYVNNIFLADTMARNDRNETVICQYLNTFRSCLLEITSCGSERDEVDRITEDEKDRLILSDCESHGVLAATTNFLLVAIATIFVRKMI